MTFKLVLDMINVGRTAAADGDTGYGCERRKPARDLQFGASFPQSRSL